jgi:O-antigen/teichoic acid export membrane protein
MAMFIIHFGDRFLLPSYRGFQELGLYAMAYKIGMLLTPLQASFESYWGVQVYQIVKRPDANQVLARTFTYFMLAMSFAALGLLVAAKPMLKILAAPGYLGAAPLVPIILLAYYLRSLSDFFRFAWLANGLPSHDAVGNWITAAVAAVAYVLLIPRFGAAGAATATLLAFLSAGIISVVWSLRVLPYRLEMGRVAMLAAITGGLSAVHFLLSPTTLTMEIVQGCVLLLAFLALLFVPGFLSPAEKGMLRSLRARFST